MPGWTDLRTGVRFPSAPYIKNAFKPYVLGIFLFLEMSKNAISDHFKTFQNDIIVVKNINYALTS